MKSINDYICYRVLDHKGIEVASYSEWHAARTKLEWVLCGTLEGQRSDDITRWEVLAFGPMYLDEDGNLITSNDG